MQASRHLPGLLAASFAVLLGLTSAAPADAADPLSMGQDCSKGCIDCQRKCHESSCMAVCTAQWSGCCMGAGMKPPTQGSCACTF